MGPFEGPSPWLSHGKCRHLRTGEPDQNWTTMHRFSASSQLLLALAAWCLSSSVEAAERPPQTFACSGGTTFDVLVNGKAAEVSFSQTERYSLRSKPSSLGRRFVSPGATLIIDGTFAAFVTSARRDLQHCMLVDQSLEASAQDGAEF